MCIVFNNNEIEYRIKALNNISDKLIGYRSVLKFFLPEFKINSTKDIKCNINFYKFEKIVSYWIRLYNNDKSDIILYINKDIEMIIVRYLYLSATEQAIKKRNEHNQQRL